MAYVNRGNAKHGLGENDEAMDNYNKALDINPNCAEAFFYLGILEYDLGKGILACVMWEAAAKLGYNKAYDLLKEYCNY